VAGFQLIVVGTAMKTKIQRHSQQRRGTDGKVGWILLWLLGVPLPILLILFLMRGCT
jgi:hypothetical protein